MNNNFSRELRNLSQKILACADEFDNIMKEIEIRQKISEDKVEKQDRILKGLKDLLVDYD